MSADEEEEQVYKDRLTRAHAIVNALVADEGRRRASTRLKDTEIKLEEISVAVARLLIILTESARRKREDIGYYDGSPFEEVIQAIGSLWERFRQRQRDQYLAGYMVNLLTRFYKDTEAGEERDRLDMSVALDVLMAFAREDPLEEELREILLEPPDPDVGEDLQGPAERAKHRVGKLIDRTGRTVNTIRNRPRSSFVRMPICDEAIGHEVTAIEVMENLAPLVFGCSVDELVARMASGLRERERLKKKAAAIRKEAT